MIVMQINPKVGKLIIFNGGGGIVEREIKLSLNQGLNKFEIANVPASFDPNSADIQLEFINPGDKDSISLQQTIVSLPDRNTSMQIIDREKGAATSIISYAIDFTRELREKVSNICEASSYRTYADMKGVFDFIINSSKEGEVIVKIIYFIADLRIKWQTTLQIDIKDDGKNAEIEGFLVVDNQTGFSYENVELGFAIFELPSTNMEIQEDYLYESEEAMPMAQQAISSLSKQKKTQRMRNLML
jgi:hypothetical protein